MGSDLFQVSAIARAGNRVSLRVRSVHPDSGVPRANESFAIMLLREAAEEGKFADAVSFDDTLDDGWQKQYACGFIQAVTARDVERGDSPQATLDITVAHPAWLEHIRKGDTWDSRAFSLVDTFDACEPIAPETAAEPTAEGDAFMWVPLVAWGDTLETGPALLEIPAYAASAYTTGERLDKPKRVPEDWIGRAVRAEDSYRVEDGTLVAFERGNATIARMGPGAFGSGGGEVKWIARLVPKAGRRGTKLTYAQVLSRVDCPPESVVVEGTRVTLTVRVPPDERSIPIEDKRDALMFLRQGLRDEHGHDYTDAGRASALVKAIEADIEKLGIDEWEVWERVADDYIAEFRVDVPRGRDLDEMSPAEARAALEAPWPLATIEIVATDPTWLAHLEQHPPRKIATRAHARSSERPRKPPSSPKKPAAKARSAKSKAKVKAKSKAKPAAKAKPKRR